MSICIIFPQANVNKKTGYYRETVSNTSYSTNQNGDQRLKVLQHTLGEPQQSHLLARPRITRDRTLHGLRPDSFQDRDASPCLWS
jgi:hypothetical protein